MILVVLQCSTKTEAYQEKCYFEKVFLCTSTYCQYLVTILSLLLLFKINCITNSFTTHSRRLNEKEHLKYLHAPSML